MKAIVQRVRCAEVSVAGSSVGSIQRGLVVLCGIAQEDTEEDVAWMARRLVSIQVFPDSCGKMAHSIRDIHGELLIVSQGTLFVSFRNRNRPSFLQAATHEKAKKMYNALLEQSASLLGKAPQCGVFQSKMDLVMDLDGPVTVILESNKGCNDEL